MSRSACLTPEGVGERMVMVVVSGMVIVMVTKMVIVTATGMVMAITMVSCRGACASQLIGV